MGESTHPQRSAAGKLWHGTTGFVILGAVAVAALITIFVWSNPGRIAEPAPLPTAPGKTISALDATQSTPVRLTVGQFLRLALPGGADYSTVVEQPDAGHPVIEDLLLPGQQPQLRADALGHATVEVMREPACAAAGSCIGKRTLYGTLDVTVTADH